MLRTMPVALALAAVSLATAHPAAAQAPEPGFVLSLPETDWGLGLSLQDFVITESRTRPDGKARIIRADRRAAGMILSAFIVPAPSGDSAVACRDAFWQQLQNGPAAASYRDIRKSETGEAALS